jgi:hypothetical protein
MVMVGIESILGYVWLIPVSRGTGQDGDQRGLMSCTQCQQEQDNHRIRHDLYTNKVKVLETTDDELPPKGTDTCQLA